MPDEYLEVFTITESHPDVTAKISGADKAKVLAITDAAKTGCPISRLLKTGLTIHHRSGILRNDRKESGLSHPASRVAPDPSHALLPS